MDSLLVAINAKYAHTNPAVRSIAVFAHEKGVKNLSFLEFTINQRIDVILAELYLQQSSVYLFSCYIWNIELVKALARELRKIRPDARLYAGGPEVSWHSDAFLHANPWFDGVITGEGEASTAALLLALQQNQKTDALPGLTIRTTDGAIAKGPAEQPLPMDILPFPYEDLDQLNGRILYYESMRGCPFHCSYCISSIEKGVRFRSTGLVEQDLLRFLQANVRQVKFVDRTFNCNKKHAMFVWRFLQQHDNGLTNFHFELAGELLDEETITYLSSVRPGLFQFEIGVQSTNLETLQEINRPANLAQLFQNVERLSAPGNIHLHLDLIAGLPFEDHDSFIRSFNDVYSLHPAQFQLGFLKVLKGSGMEQNAPAYGLQCRDYAPYEVLQTKWLSFGELQTLKAVEEMLELYYNSGRFSHLVAYLVQLFPTPYLFYKALATFWQQKGLHRNPPDKTGTYQILGEFAVQETATQGDHIKWLCKYDILLHEKPKKLPLFVDIDMSSAYRKSISAFYHNQALLAEHLPHLQHLGPKQLAHQTHIERFPYHPRVQAGEPVFLLFDYSRRDIQGHALVLQLPSCYFIS